MSTTHQVSGVPFPLTTPQDNDWHVAPETGTVRVTAAPRSDIFIDPGADPALATGKALNAVTLLGDAPAGDFQFRARVSVDFQATFDAGVLLLWFDERHWAKLCFEYSPDGEAMVVSVVNREVADDANGFVVEGDAVWLRVSRIGGAFAYHASLDGESWRLIRYFALDAPGRPLRVGLEAQAPTGEGCAVTFERIAFTADRLAELRDGS
ncbi:DUF1349 domain-containing protein [Streptomyces sp. DSM 44915]|uniref:DUF1349 domain-containing protein n=1 Tax=Streptomyces chisholmiae TaxID=3075540 RepID=A0ABU2JVY4_9ACTN|nr:DUF1349 domain-containing protein [Streptomyces sp. DSM 44915]MDT0269129.1 DUF1349 domain-containing protein [Streptomyces sp. DSM 44915]